ncbi:hypothetical protein KO481_00210 [Nocardia sp. NEAU-G5]|jgi:hypothetical protein|uniref:Uncharacterized protein n=1 Tax=Nocardia albiluteola TaxID=2842303 RepID=A0ABS6APM1_9NOCA|nr:hypothetical protein [Nocardia albiluteola]MBU3059957.1 hypothetical protein [Nocardia albiluteola]
MALTLTPSHPAARHLRWMFLAVVTGSFVFLIPWVVYLATSLPSRHEVTQWDVAWVGFDFFVIGSIGMTALWAWLHRRIFIPWAIVTATLLCCDAWFDIVLDWNTPDLPVSLLTAGAGELPLAALLFYVARRLIRLSIAAAWAHQGQDEIPRISMRRLLLERMPDVGVMTNRKNAARDDDQSLPAYPGARSQ